ncbi:hypothetical protein L3Y34_011481 [Caenorhabditis briggsae]|uniref:Uncharacterized protein n=1 Tax=Caenorhabditis briggsae TaxID=6238 RepID=A0AAE9CV37_CAEBR|nr:hypothetical protein L3Y34_011481 [Caenorhabditis briggsae]
MYASDSQVADFSAYWDQSMLYSKTPITDGLTGFHGSWDGWNGLEFDDDRWKLNDANVVANKLMADKQVIARLWTRDTRAEIVYKKVNRFLSEEEALPINMLEELMNYSQSVRVNCEITRDEVIPILIRKIFHSLYTGTFSYELFHNKMAAFDSLDAFTSEFQLYQHVTCILRYYRTETIFTEAKQKKDSSIPKKIQHIVAEEEDDLFLDQFDVNFKERLLTRFWLLIALLHPSLSNHSMNSQYNAK